MPPSPAPPPPEPLFILRGHRASVQCVAFTPDCRSLAAGDAEGELKLWDVHATQRPTASIRAHESASGILQVACPSSHPWVISQGRDGVVKCWELHSGSSFSSAPVQQLVSGCYNFCRFALLEAGQTSSSCSVAPQQQQQTEPKQDHTAAAAADAVAQVVGFAADDLRQAAAGSGVRQGSSQQPAAAGLLTQQLRQPHQQQQQQQPAPDCAQLAALAVQDQAAHSGAAPAAAAGDGSKAGVAAAAAAVPPDLTEAAEEQLMLRGSGSGHPSSSSSSSHMAASTHAAGCCYLAVPSEDPAQLGIWQLGGQAAGSAAGGSGRPAMLLTQSKGPDSPPHRGQCMAVVLLQPQGRPLHALTGYEDGSVALWDTRNTATCIAAQKLHSEPVMCLAAAADCSSGLSGSADASLASFDIDISKGHLAAGPKQPLPQQGLADVAIRPDSRIAATAGWDAKIRVWRCSSKRQPLAILRWHSQQVACVGFSSDSRLLAAGGRDNFISLWSLYPPPV